MTASTDKKTRTRTRAERARERERGGGWIILNGWHLASQGSDGVQQREVTRAASFRVFFPATLKASRARDTRRITPKCILCSGSLFRDCGLPRSKKNEPESEEETERGERGLARSRPSDRASVPRGPNFQVIMTGIVKEASGGGTLEEITEGGTNGCAASQLSAKRCRAQFGSR